jgi:hypothetical protein
MRRMRTSLAVLALAASSVAQASWMQLFPANSPSSPDTHGMAYEPNSQRIVLFGG